MTQDSADLFGLLHYALTCLHINLSTGSLSVSLCASQFGGLRHRGFWLRCWLMDNALAFSCTEESYLYTASGGAAHRVVAQCVSLMAALIKGCSDSVRTLMRASGQHPVSLAMRTEHPVSSG